MTAIYSLLNTQNSIIMNTKAIQSSKYAYQVTINIKNRLISTGTN
eukprot:UN06467